MFATEIQAMAEDCGLDKIRVCYCDTVVRKNQQGEWWDIYELDQGDDLELQVRGGGEQDLSLLLTCSMIIQMMWMMFKLLYLLH